MTNISVLQTVGEGFNPFSRQFRFESSNNDLPAFFGQAFDGSVGTLIGTTIGATIGTTIGTTVNRSGKTLPQNASNLVSQPFSQPSTQQEFNDLANELSKQVQFIQRDLRFTVDEHSGKTVIVVKDSQTDEVVREIPSKKLRQLAQNLRNVQEQLDGSTGHLSTLKGHLLDVHV